MSSEKEITGHEAPPANNTADDRELKSMLDFTKTKTDHITVWIVNQLGSMKFLVACIVFFMVWIAWNMHILPFGKPFDRFPFATLEMLVSIFAIILSVTVLINQNRQGKMEKTRQQVEFEVNVRAEHEITKVLNMLHEIQQHIGIAHKEDKELEEMKESTDLREIHNTLNNVQGNDEIFPGSM